MTSADGAARRSWRSRARRGASGALVGALIQGGAAAMLVAAGALRLAPAQSPATPMAQLESAGRLCLIALAQELLFRGWLPRALAPLGFWPAAALGGLAFAAIHLGRAGETPAGLRGLFIFSLLAAAAVRRTGTLWWAVGFHMAWNLTQDIALGLPDAGEAAAAGWLAARPQGPAWLTGGSAGPEGGAPAQLLMLAAFLVFAGRSQVAARR